MATYQAPGVSVQETTQPSVASLIATPDDICLIGYVPQYETVSTSPIKLNGLAKVNLGVPATNSSTFSIASVSAVDPLKGGSAYVSANGYTNTQYDIVTENNLQYIRREKAATGDFSAVLTKAIPSATSTANIKLNVSTGNIPAATASTPQTILVENDAITYTGNTTTTGAVTLSGVTRSTTDNVPVAHGATTTITAVQTTGSDGSTGSGYVTYTTGTTLHGYSTGDTVILSGFSPDGYNGTFTVTATPTTSKFTVANTTTGTPTTYGTVLTTGSVPVYVAATDTTGATQIPDGIYVNVVWKYTPSNHFTAQLYTSMSDIINKFGPAFVEPDQKTINQPITLAASLAFLNGATRVWIQPLFKLVNNVPTQPSDSEIADATATWNPTLQLLQGLDNLGVIVPIIGQSQGGNANLTDSIQLNIIKECQKYTVAQRASNQNYVILIAGEDGVSSSNGLANTLRAHVASLDNDQQAVLVSPTKFQTVSPKGANVDIGGQYAAAAVAGRMVSFAPSKTLTRKSLLGLTYVDPRSKDDKNLDAQNGLFVIETNNNGVTQVRHALTVNTQTVAKSELSVVRAKQKMVTSIMQTIDNQIIGTVVADNNAPLVIESAIRGVLQTLVSDGDIVGYGDVVATVRAISPTIIDVTFSYRPSFPVNYVNVSFAVDLTSGSSTLTNTNNSGVANG
jgi:hypothetical protein